MNVTETLDRAMKEETLADALSVACIWECERAISQAKENNYEGWETCFKHVITQVLEKWETGSLEDALAHISQLQDRNEVLRAGLTTMRHRAKEIIDHYEKVVG